MADWAARAFFLHGGDVKIVPVLSSVMSPASPFLSPGLNNTPSNLQQSYATFTSPVSGGFNPNAVSTPQLAPYTLSNMNESPEYQFSGRHNGLNLYFGRILRPVWLLPLARDVGKSQLLDSVVTRNELLNALGQLNALKGFVHANIHQTGPYN